MIASPDIDKTKKTTGVSNPLQSADEDHNGKESFGFLMKHTPANLHGEIIGKLASSYYYIHEDINIDALADAMSQNKEIFAAGVVDGNRLIKGIILRHELLDTISKRFGRDIYRNRSVKNLMSQTDVFNFNNNIYGVAGRILTGNNKNDNSYYLLKDEHGRFEGIFSTRDVLVFFSEITRKDIILAKTIQSCIVRDETRIAGSGFEIIGSTMMAKEVGGDFYSIAEYSPGRWFIAVCDVSGKGISAALVSVTIGGMVHLYDFKNGIENFIIRLNEYILNTFKTERFLTGVFIDYDHESGFMNLYDMGHSYVYLNRDKTVSRLRSRIDNYPIGIIEGCNPSPGKFRLIQGDTLIVFTDGLNEQKNPEGEEYGSRRLSEFLLEKSGDDLISIKNKLFAELIGFRGNQPQNDDMTLVMLKKN